MPDFEFCFDEINEIFERAFSATEAEHAGLTARLPFGYKPLASPSEQAVITAARFARRCGWTGQRIADELNRRQITHRGRQWTAQRVYRLLRPYKDRRGEQHDVGYLTGVFDNLKK
jgi:hypothetical protein